MNHKVNFTLLIVLQVGLWYLTSQMDWISTEICTGCKSYKVLDPEKFDSYLNNMVCPRRPEYKIESFHLVYSTPFDKIQLVRLNIVLERDTTLIIAPLYACIHIDTVYDAVTKEVHEDVITEHKNMIFPFVLFTNLGLMAITYLYFHVWLRI